MKIKDWIQINYTRDTFNSIEYLRLNNHVFDSFEGIELLPSIYKLTISDCVFKTIDYHERIPELLSITLNNTIIDISFIKNLKIFELTLTGNCYQLNDVYNTIKYMDVTVINHKNKNDFLIDLRNKILKEYANK